MIIIDVFNALPLWRFEVPSSFHFTKPFPRHSAVLTVRTLTAQAHPFSIPNYPPVTASRNLQSNTRNYKWFNFKIYEAETWKRTAMCTSL